MYKLLAKHCSSEYSFSVIICVWATRKMNKQSLLYNINNEAIVYGNLPFWELEHGFKSFKDLAEHKVKETYVANKKLLLVLFLLDHSYV